MFIVGHLLPDDGVLTGLVLCFSLHTDELNAAGVQGGGDPNLRGGGGQRVQIHHTTNYTRYTDCFTLCLFHNFKL